MTAHAPQHVVHVRHGPIHQFEQVYRRIVQQSYDVQDVIRRMIYKGQTGLRQESVCSGTADGRLFVTANVFSYHTGVDALEKTWKILRGT